MKKIIFILFTVVSVFFIMGCAQTITCNKPYILVGTSCCLDTNDNGICDDHQKDLPPEQDSYKSENTADTAADEFTNDDEPAKMKKSDRSEVPTYDTELFVKDLNYNTISNDFEVTIRNPSTTPLYFKGTYTVIGDESQTVSDIESEFLDSGKDKTITYTLAPDNPSKVKIFIIFGESKTSYDKVYEKEMNINNVMYRDESKVVIKNVNYEAANRELIVTVENEASFNSYVMAEVVGLTIDSKKEVIQSKKKLIEGDSQYPLLIELPAEPMDNFVTIRLYYGGREHTLSKVSESMFKI